TERDREYGPGDVIERVKDLPPEIEDRQEFDQDLLDAGVSIEPGEKVLGYSEGSRRPIHVTTDHLEIPKTLIHERTHQLSHPAARERLGAPLHEGITEDIAILNLGSEPIEGIPQCYPEERAIARQLRLLCGEEAINEAYFRGDLQRLRERLESHSGKGALDKLRRRMEKLDNIE
ncbi:MAG TPA: hypothetical protein PKH07_20635, partial [bacterium]|nr:hypothetical protein [bacterium]